MFAFSKGRSLKCLIIYKDKITEFKNQQQSTINKLTDNSH